MLNKFLCFIGFHKYDWGEVEAIGAYRYQEGVCERCGHFKERQV